jgi:hypothetical protein
VAVDRARLLDRRFLDALDGFAGGAPIDLDAPIRAGSRLTVRAAIELFDAQIASRHLDFAARALRARGEGFWTMQIDIDTAVLETMLTHATMAARFARYIHDPIVVDGFIVATGDSGYQIHRDHRGPGGGSWSPQVECFVCR